jgi:hypothetical protein
MLLISATKTLSIVITESFRLDISNRFAARSSVSELLAAPKVSEPSASSSSL